MKRDMDLVRKILIVMADAPTGYAPNPLRIDGYDEATIGYHTYLMVDGDLITGADLTASQDQSPSSVPATITWQGHEFLEAARESSSWNRAKGLAASAGNASFKVLVDALMKIAMDKIQNP